MSGFDNTAHFPSALALGAVLTLERRTDIQRFASGRESRNALWAGSVRRWEAGGAVRTLAQLQALVRFFEARQGRLRGFRFRDPLAFQTGTGGPISPLDQGLGTGDGERTLFALILGDPAEPEGGTRRIYTPRADGFVLAINGSAQFTGFALDTVSGTVAFDLPPEPGAAITAGFSFDTPVRFDMDTLEISLDAFGAGRAPRVPLIEMVP